jgi:predicted lipase
MKTFEELKQPNRENFNIITSANWKHGPNNVDYSIEKYDDLLLIKFRPTTDSTDWKFNFKFFAKKFEIYQGSNIYAHEGFSQQYLACRNEVLDSAYQNDIKKIFVAGYSLGGALTQLCIEDIVWHFKDKKEIYGVSYEGPRAFKANFMVKTTVKDFITLVKCRADIVTHVPPAIFGFRFYGKKVNIGHWYDVFKWPFFAKAHMPDSVRDNLDAYNK